MVPGHDTRVGLPLVQFLLDGLIRIDFCPLIVERDIDVPLHLVKQFPILIELEVHVVGNLRLSGWAFQVTG